MSESAPGVGEVGTEYVPVADQDRAAVSDLDEAEGAPVWLITGCSAGFSRALADPVLARGDRVVATARRVEAIEGLAGDRVVVVALDVTCQEQIDTAVRAALERFGRIDVLVNNAGYSSVGAVEEIDMDDLRLLMETMFFGAVALTKGRAAARTYDPELADLFAAHGSSWFDRLQKMEPRDAVLDPEPEPHRTLQGAELDSANGGGRLR